MPRRSMLELYGFAEIQSNTKCIDHGLIGADVLAELAIPKQPLEETGADETLWIYSFKTRKWTQVDRPEPLSDSEGSSLSPRWHVFDMKREFH